MKRKKAARTQVKKTTTAMRRAKANAGAAGIHHTNSGGTHRKISYVASGGAALKNRYSQGKAYYKEVTDKDKQQGRADDFVNSNARAIRDIGLNKAKSTAVQGGKKTVRTVFHYTGTGIRKAAAGSVYAAYSVKDYKRQQLIHRMKEYIKTHGTLIGSGFEDKLDTLYTHEKQEINKCIIEYAGKRHYQSEKDFVKQKRAAKTKPKDTPLDTGTKQCEQTFKENKAAFDKAKQDISKHGVITDKDLKAKSADFTAAQKQELKKAAKKQKVIYSAKGKTTEKAYIKKKAVNKQVAEKTQKASKGLATVAKGIGSAVKAAAASSVAPLLLIGLIMVGAIAIIIPGFIKNAENMNTSQQIIKVAEKEIGTVGGGKYRQWYTGSADGEMWCATFVSWCANQCGLIDQGVYPKFQGCDEGLNWFKNKGLFDYTSQYGGAQYTPQIGDVIFFTGRGGVYDKNDSTHVGLVQGVENGNVLTIEGNTSNSVLPRRYSFDNPRILGYARPQYPLGMFGYGEADFSGDSTSEIVWNFLKSMGCNDAAAAGIMGNIHGESSMNPGAIESNGEGHGLCQWSFGRKQILFDRAAAAGKPWQDVEVQLTLLWDELNGADKATQKILNANYGGIEGLKNSPSIEYATEAFCMAFERPSSASLRVRQRIPYARRYYELYANKGGI